MLKIQSTVDWLMAFRVQVYALRIYESIPFVKSPNRETRLPPILAIVVYNGRRPWRAARRLSDLVGPGTRPAEPPPAGAPTFTGESYVLIDLQGLAAEDLPPDNVVSLLAQAHGMRNAEDVMPTLREAWRVLRGPPREGLSDVFFPWLAKLGKQIGVDLSMLGVKSMREDMEADGEERLMVEERLQASLAKMKAQSYQEGLEEAREEKLDLVRRMTARRFGADTARRLDPSLVGTKDPERLSSVFDWIIDCTTGPELLARLRHSD